METDLERVNQVEDDVVSHAARMDVQEQTLPAVADLQRQRRGLQRRQFHADQVELFEMRHAADDGVEQAVAQLLAGLFGRNGAEAHEIQVDRHEPFAFLQVARHVEGRLRRPVPCQTAARHAQVRQTAPQFAAKRTEKKLIHSSQVYSTTCPGEHDAFRMGFPLI